MTIYNIMFAIWSDLLGKTTTTFTNPFPFINPPFHPLTHKQLLNDLKGFQRIVSAVSWQDWALCASGFHRSPMALFPGFAFADIIFSNLMWIFISSQFARVVKGVDLRSTAGNCAWVRTPQLTEHLIEPITQLARECLLQAENFKKY